MKKLIYGTLFLALVGIGFVGCKKENKLPLSETNKNEITTNGKMLIFETVESFEKSEEPTLEEAKIIAKLTAFVIDTKDPEA